jgi:electron transfer flavoprotein alpha subunit
MATLSEVLVCGEIADGTISSITLELLGIGRKLSNDLGQPLSALLIGEGIQNLAQAAVTLGADKVYVAGGVPFADSHPDLYVSLIAEVCRQMKPSVILLGQTDMGREVAPRLAARLDAVVILDCTELSPDTDSNRLLAVKPVYGGNALATWAAGFDRPQVITVRPRAAMPAEPDSARSGEVIDLDITADGSAVKGRLVETVKEESKGIKLEEAKIIVCGGGGIGGNEGFALLEELASVLGGTVGVTRIPCDEGWMPLSLEVGQTGRIVCPDLYVAVGVSGAPQHMAGCSGSKRIVAINRDAEAHIFKEADFGLVGDYREALPALIEKCKALVK